eukprot:13189359-Heterocapsa_arctica.AAC.1
MPMECQLYIRNLPSDTTDLDLYELFSSFGAIAPRGVKAMTGPDGVCTGIGFIDFLNTDGPQAAQAAIMTLNGTQMPDGSILSIASKSPGKGKGGKTNDA